MFIADKTIIGKGGFETVIEREEKEAMVEAALESWGGAPKKVLLVGPDMTRLHSGAGELTHIFHEKLSPQAQVDVIPALGTHVPMSADEIATMYPGVPADRFRIHNWRSEVRKVGQVPQEYIEDLSAGRLHFTIDIEVNRQLLDGGYDLIVSIGQVVPHEVIGMANHIKNILVGLGGSDIINKTHYLGAVHGMENIMGRIDTPVRRVMEYAATEFLSEMPIKYVQTVIAADTQGELRTRGVFIGEGRAPFIHAAKLSQQVNITVLEKPIRKAVVWLDPVEFKSHWLGNKAIYRTRMAMADDGELIVLGPGLEKFGEDARVEELIRKYGYRGTPYTLEKVEQNADLRENLSTAAHLIHGSSEGRFRITYAPGHLTREETEGVGYGWADLDEMKKRYDPNRLRDGFNEVDGEEIFFIGNPALGLWSATAI